MSTLIDNTEKLKMVDTLKKHLSDQYCHTVKIATGYWDLLGLNLVKDELETFLERDNTKLYLLIGTDPVVRINQLENPKYKGKTFPEDFIRVQINDLGVKPELFDSVNLLLKYCGDDEDTSKIKIRIYRKDEEGDAQFLHAKCYIFLAGEHSCGIIGSSNFTKKGLEGNAELNYLEAQSQIVKSKPEEDNPNKGHDYWFEEKWNLSKPWTIEFVEEILKPSAIAKAAKEKEEEKQNILTPNELYIKYLQTQFGDIVDPTSDAIIKSYLPKKYDAYDFQIDAVKQCFSIMKRYGGFMLGDVVGLGKTVVGVLVIKKFLAEASLLSRPRNVLIVTPPSILPSWKNTIEDFDKDAADIIAPYIKFVTTGSIGKFIDDEESIEENDLENDELKQEQYGLILIDESHNFRNNDTQKYKDLDNLIGCSNPTPYVGLLSATPQNNKPADIQHQIYLFIREPNHCMLPRVEGGKLDTFFTNMKELFDRARNNPDEDEAKALIEEMSHQMYDKVLSELVVRRTRSDIKARYNTDYENLKFPEVRGPHKLSYKMDPVLCQLFADTMEAICPDDEEKHNPEKNLGFYRYSAILYFKDEKNRNRYEIRNLTVESITLRLKNIMRILLVKRLESSFSAFKKSLHNLLDYTDTMIEMLRNDTVFVCPDLNVNQIYKDCNDDFDLFTDTLRKKSKAKGGNNLEYKKNDFTDEYLVKLKEDRKLIKNLCERWDENTYDPKMEKFKESLATELFNPEINNPHHFDNQRLVIFTEAIDTQKELSRHLTNKGYKVLSVSAKNRKDMQKVIAANFDANAKKEDKRDDYNVIVTTEVLAEGVNLHRSNVILNYDAPWNATRLMQRIGRVNRIGSKEDFVHVFNFFPEPRMNAQIKLIEKAYAKLQSFHLMFGEDSKVYSEREEITSVDLSHILEDESSPFNEYFNDLKEFQHNNPERFAFIQKQPLDCLGGKLSSGSGNKALVLITDETAGLVSVYCEKDVTARTMSQLDTMECMKSNRDATFDTNADKALVKDFFKSAMNVYSSHVVHFLNSRDSNKKITEALAVLSQLRQDTSLTIDSKKILKQVELGVRNKNTFLINTLIKYGKQIKGPELSLFDANMDLNLWVENTFAIVANKATQKRGEATVAMFEIN